MAAVHKFAYHNDSIVPATDIRLSPFQTGLLSGWGLFSTLRIYNGVPFALEDHLERLTTDAARLHVEFGDLLARIPRAFDELIERNQAGEAMARVYIIRNRGGLLDTPGQPDTDLLIFTAPVRDWGPNAKLKIQPHGRDSQAPLSGTKTLTWANNLVLLEQATAEGFDDVLLLNERGEVAECTSANVFIVKEERLITPPLDSGALPGVSRKLILRAAPEHDIEVEERALYPQDLFSADEVFITSSTREVQPVTRIDDLAISGAGPMVRKVEHLFRREVERAVATARASASAR